MGGKNRCLLPKSGDILHGKKGKYKILEEIGKGGNGTVYTVDIIEKRCDIPDEKGYVIKVLTPNPNRENLKAIERRKRFAKEIETVIALQSEVKDILPIFDYCVSNSIDDGEYDWYLMPRAKEYNVRKNNYDLLQKIDDIIKIGYVVNCLHERGFAHRDIKPSNILFYRGRLCLSDFGLVWSESDKSIITHEGEFLGPVNIRPPEMENIDLLENATYYKSDVYLFAKTAWIIITGNSSGFRGEYNRNDKQIYLDKNKYENVSTFEPFHTFLERTTKYYYDDRIEINEALQMLHFQKQVLLNKMPPSEIMSLRFQEETKYLHFILTPDQTVFFNEKKIFEFLSGLKGIAFLSVKNLDRNTRIGLIRAVELIHDNHFKMTIDLPLSINGKREQKIIYSRIVSLSYDDKEELYFIQSSAYRDELMDVEKCRSIRELVSSTKKEVLLDGAFNMIITIS